WMHPTGDRHSDATWFLGAVFHGTLPNSVQADVAGAIQGLGCPANVTAALGSLRLALRQVLDRLPVEFQLLDLRPLLLVGHLLSPPDAICIVPRATGEPGGRSRSG